MRCKRGEGRTSSVDKGTLLPAKDVTPAWERGAIVSHDGWRWEGEGRLVPRSLGRGTRSSVLHPLNTFLSHFSRSCEFELAGEPDVRAGAILKHQRSGSSSFWEPVSWCSRMNTVNWPINCISPETHRSWLTERSPPPAGNLS